MRLSVLLSLLAIATVSSGCATLFTGSSDTISFTSEPAGAEVVIDGLVVGRTPTTVSVKRPGLGDRMVTMRMEGYDPVTFTLSKQFNAVSILNLAGIIGWGVDIATGAVMKYDRRAYQVDMQRGSVSMNIDDLERDDSGALVLPDIAGDITVVDPEAGIGIVFSNN